MASEDENNGVGSYACAIIIASANRLECSKAEMPDQGVVGILRIFNLPKSVSNILQLLPPYASLISLQPKTRLKNE